jgi:hypothetical protein
MSSKSANMWFEQLPADSTFALRSSEHLKGVQSEEGLFLYQKNFVQGFGGRSPRNDVATTSPFEAPRT